MRTPFSPSGSAGRPGLVLAFLLLLLAAGCGDEPPGPRTILITIDTLREARVGAWGDPSARTPWLDRTARRGWQYANARCDVPFTLPSHTSLFMGVPAVAHGVRLNGRALGPSARTVAEAMAEAGRETAAVVSTGVLRARFGLSQGFDRYDDRIETPYRRYDLANYPRKEDLPKVQRRADETSDLAIRALEASGSSPLFLWVHYFDPHYPYDPPPPFGASAFAGPYAGEVAFTDHCLGRLLRHLETMRVDRIAIAADHGESLGDFGEDEHGLLVYDATMRVPFVLAGRDAQPAGVIRDEPVALADLGATLVADLDRDGARGAGDARADRGPGAPGEPFGLGRDLLARGGRQPDVPLYGESIASREEHGASGLKCLVVEGWKYVHAPVPELYDLATDPGERTNRAKREPERTADLRRRLGDMVARLHGGEWRAVIPAPDDAGAPEELLALGYLGGSGGEPAVTSIEDEMAVRGFNPRDSIRLMVAGRYLSRRLWRQAEWTLGEFFRLSPPDPATPEGRALLAVARNDLGIVRTETDRPADALRAFEAALELQPDYESAARGKAAALRALGRAGDSLAFADSVLAERPGLVSMRAARVVALEDLGRTAEAREERRRIGEAVSGR